MRLRISGFVLLVSSAVAVACASHKLEPPQGLNSQNSGPVGNGMASDVEAGAGQFGATGPAAFAPAGGLALPEVFAWLALMQQTFPTPTVITSDTTTASPTPSGSSPTPTGSPTGSPLPSPTDTTCTSCSPTPTPSAAPSVTPPATPTPTPTACPIASQVLSAPDADVDTFPDTSVTASVSGCEITSGIGGVAATGSVTVVDDSAGSPTFVFTRTFNVGVTAGTASGSIQSTVTGRQPTAASYQIQENAHLTLTDGADVLQHVSNWTLVFTPSAGVWTAPWLPADGTMTVDGAWGATINGLTVNASVTSPTPLTIAANCATGVTAGAVQADVAATQTDPKTHQLVVTWTGCGQTTRTLDGQPVP